MTTAPVAVFGQILNGGTDHFALDIQIGPAATLADNLTLRLTTQSNTNGQIQTTDVVLEHATQAPNYHYIVLDTTFYDFFDLTSAWYFNMEADFTRQGVTPARLIAAQLLNNGQVIDTLGDPAGTTPALADNTTLTRNTHFFAAPGTYSSDDYTVTPGADYSGFDQYTLTIPPAGATPSVLSMQVAGAAHGTSDTATFQVTFSQPVHGVTTSSFVLQNPQGGGGTVSSVETTDLVTWTVHVRGLMGAGTHELALANGMSGITGTYAVPLAYQPDAVADYVLDASAPVFNTVTATATGEAAGLLNTGDTVEFHVSTATAATPSADADVTLTLSNGVVLHATMASLYAGTTDLVFVYTVGAQGGAPGSEDTANLTVHSVALAQGTLDDGAGHAATFTLPAQAVLGLAIDTLAPDLQFIGIADGDGQPIAAGSALRADDEVRLELRASEPLQHSAGLSVELSNGAVATLAGMSNDGQSFYFTYKIQAGEDAASLVITGLRPHQMATDAAGNPLSSVLLADLGISVDTVSPAVAITGVSPDLGASASDGITFAGRDLVLSGTAEAGSAVVVSEVDATGTHLLGTASIAGGQWSYDLGATLAAGQHHFVVSATDRAGNIGTATLPVTVAAAATVPVIQGIGPDALHLGTATSSGMPAVFGLATPGSTIAVTIDGRAVGTTTADDAGAWSLATGALTDGTHLLVTRATGLAGDVARGMPFAFQVDTRGPVVGDVAVASTTGTHGSVLLPGDTAHLAVAFDEAVFLTGTLFLHLSNGEVLASSGSGADGKSVLFDYTVQMGQDIQALQAVSITADQGTSLVDRLGNTGTFSFALDDLGLSVHTVVPAAPTLSLVDAEGHAIAGVMSATGALAAGEVEAGGIVEYSMNGGAFGAAMPVFARDGSQDGQHTVSVRAVDSYGLTSAATALTFTLDTIAPAVALIDLSLVTSGGSDRIVLAGTLETVAGTTVHVFDGDNDLGAATLDGHGGWSFATTLATRSHALHAVATDAAGNMGETPRVTPFSGDTVVLPFKLAQAPISSAGAVSIDSGGVHATLRGIGHFQFTDGMLDQADGAAGTDDLFYSLRNPDVWAAQIDPDQHYHQFGWKEGRDPNAYFSTSGYLAANPDVAAAGVDPLEHYEQFGWKEGRKASDSFDSARYLSANSDVAAAGVNPLIHFLTFGQVESRSALSTITHGGFDAGYYLATNPDVAASGMDAWVHFMQFGAHEGRDPNALFDTDAYLAANPDVAATGMNPLVHYNEIGWREGRNPGPGFNTAHYEAAYPDVAAAGINPLVHYLERGIYEGRMPLADYSMPG